MRSRSNVSSVEIEIRSASSSRSRGIDPAGAIAEQPADLAREECPELRLGERRQLADPLHACAGEPLLGARPDPGEEPRRRAGARKRASRPGGTTVIPPGFRRSDATLQTTLDVETPSEHESDVEPRTAACTASARPLAWEKRSATEPRSR